jgi:indolepyruvate ferredoxin oxidoreductase beta subunit
MENRTINILFCGTGGQGVLKAAEVCALAAMIDGYHVKKSEVHGMAQRGGSVESHVRFGSTVFSPLIPKGQADFLVAFHAGERDRMKAFLKPDGIDLFPYLDKAQQTLKDRRYLNTYLLGILAGHLPLKQESWLVALDRAFAGKNVAANRQVFLEAGR